MTRAAIALSALFFCLASANAENPWQVARSVADFDRFDLVPPGLVDAVRKANELRVEGKCVTGGAECDLDVPETGWYELFAEPEGGLNEFVIDGNLSLHAGSGRKSNGQDRYGKVDNLWLTRGKHTIRVQRYVWWGFWPPLRGVLLRRSDSSVAKTIRVECARGPGEVVCRKGESLELIVYTAGQQRPAPLVAQLKDKQTGRVVGTSTVELPAGADLKAIPVRLACTAEGVFEAQFLASQGRIGSQDLKPILVHVVDAAPVHRPGGDLAKTLIEEIDCARRAPDFVSGGPTEVIRRPFGEYRLSGKTGFLYAQHHNLPESWFAYPIATPDVGKPHLLEVDYPDDEDRTFLIVVRESSPDDYPVAGGVDSGGPWSLSNRVQTQSLLFWPKTASPRVAFLAAHNGRRAAASRVRVYRIDGEIPPLDVPRSGGRTFLNWYEEGSNFAGFYGGTKNGLEGFGRSADMWARELCYMGGNLMVPTVSIYQMNLYPSRYNRSFAETTSPDVLRVLLLACEKHGVRLVAEFHPEARELDGPAAPPKPPEHGLASKTGQISSYETQGPMHHPLHSASQEWYLGMLGELADRYKDSPALAGVSLRLMPWSNPSLNNFHSLDWGYDDLSIRLFEKETGTAVPGDAADPNRFAKRHDWLLAHARRAWIDWRCDKIADLYRKAVARVRRARKDLCVYSTVFELGDEAGVDPERLAAIDGVVLVHARHGYGRQAWTYEGFLADQAMRDKLLDPPSLHAVQGKSEPAAFLFGARYFEATERVLRPKDLGLPGDTKDRWISGVVNPAGRHYLERYAVALAETDALVLGDGGNAYTLGQPLLREFLSEFRRLPSVRFAPRTDARDPVALWELARGDDFLFYAVNRERYPVRLAISLRTAGPVRRLATGREVALTDGRLQVELKPYQLLAFQTPAGSRIADVATTVPPEDRAHVQSMLECLEKLDRDAAASTVQLDDRSKRLLKDAIEEARQCLREGRFWRARTLMEHHQLAQYVYNPALRFPPGLAYLMDPEKARLLAAAKLPRPKDSLIHLDFDRMEGGALRVSTPLDIRATCEGGCELQEGRVGKALHLDGKTGKVVIQGPGTERLNLNGFTLSVWINPESVTERRGILMKQKWPAGYALLFWNGSVLAEAGSQAGSDACRTPDGFCRPGVWRHLAATVESGRAITLYVDGEEVKRIDMKQRSGPTDVPLLIGWNSWGGRQNDPSPGPFAGRIDELKIWNRALSADEVLADMAGVLRQD